MTAENRFRPYPLQSRWRNHLTRMLQRQVGDADKPGINVGRRLQELRQAQGLSQRVLAEMSGLNFNTLSLIENEKTSPNVSTLQQLAEALNVPVMAFLNRAGNAVVLFSKRQASGRAQCFLRERSRTWAGDWHWVKARRF